jgi:hypothetical protein
VRMTQSEIEVDCNCVDILNALEKQDFGEAHSLPSVHQDALMNRQSFEPELKLSSNKSGTSFDPQFKTQEVEVNQVVTAFNRRYKPHLLQPAQQDELSSVRTFGNVDLDLSQFEPSF